MSYRAYPLAHIRHAGAYLRTSRIYPVPASDWTWAWKCGNILGWFLQLKTRYLGV